MIARALGLAALALLALPSMASAGTKRVPDDFYGMNFHRIAALGSEEQDTHLREIAAAGVTQLRLPVPWQHIEPTAPVDGRHSYRFDAIDAQVEAAARHGLQVQAMLAYAPWWARTAEGVSPACRGAASGATRAFDDYADAATAVARRYGRDGAFWAQHPGLPYRPVVRYEIWNAPNTRGTWCPTPDPEAYGRMLARASRAVRAVDRDAMLGVGGLGFNPAGTSESYVSVRDFLTRMRARRRARVGQLDEVGVHVYPSPAPGGRMKLFPLFRAWMRGAGIPDSVPMHVNELGWSLVDGVTEPERAVAFANVADRVARTNCNISGINPHTWITEEEDPTDREHFFGIASPSDGELYPSGQAYSFTVKLQRGLLPHEAPTRTLALC